MKRYLHYPVVDASLQALYKKHGINYQRELTNEDREIASRFNVESHLQDALKIRASAGLTNHLEGDSNDDPKPE